MPFKHHFAGLGLTAVLMLMLTPTASGAGPRLLHDGPLARDVFHKVEWMRCSLGQVWLDGNCVGSARLLTHDQLDEALIVVNASTGYNWRLPTRDELKRLVEETQAPPRINTESFPGTEARGYWTSEANFLAPRYYWSVNFLTGHTFGRTNPSVPNAVRLVRDINDTAQSPER